MNKNGTIRHYRSKWSRYEQDRHTPKGKTLQRVEELAPGSTHELQHPLWEVLDLSTTTMMNGDAFLRRLDPEVQEIIFDSLPIGISRCFQRAAITQSLLDKLERRASLDVLACLTWLLREASLRDKQVTARKVARNLHNVLLMLSIELHERKAALPLLEIFIRDILPLGLERYFRMWMVPSDFVYASARLNILVYQTKRGNKRTLSWVQRVKIMHKLLQGDIGLDVKYAMAPQFDLNDELGIPEEVVKDHCRETRLREWGWEQIMSGEHERFPPTELLF